MSRTATLLEWFGVGPEVRGVDWADLWLKGWDPDRYFGTRAGEVVTEGSSLTISTVFGALRISTEAIGGLPVGGFAKDQARNGHDVRLPLLPGPTWLDFDIGPWTKHDVLAQIAWSLYIDGNAYLSTFRDAAGRVLWVEVLDPSVCEPERNPLDASLIETRIGGEMFHPFDVLHIRYITRPGDLKGLSTLRYAREAIGQAQAASKMGSSMMARGGVPSVGVEVPGSMTPAGIDALRETWADVHGGAGNAGKLAILSGGAKFSNIAFDPSDLQFLETRQFSVPDIARFFGVSPSQLGHSDGPEMGKSISDKNTMWIQYGLGSPVSRIEHGLSFLLRTDPSVREARPFIKLSTEGLLRGDWSTRWAIWVQAIREGILTINEVRRFEDLPPVEWGDQPISVQVQEDVAGGDPAGEVDADLAAAGLVSMARSNGRTPPEGD